MSVEQYNLVANDWTNLELIINDLTQRVVGQEVHPTSNPTFASLTITEDLIVTGDLTLSGLTEGSVLFVGVDGIISEDNSNFFWDDANNRLGLGRNDPDWPLDLHRTGQSAVFGMRSDTSGTFILGQRSNGTLASPSTVTSGQSLIVIAGGGYDGTSWQHQKGQIEIESAAVWSSGDTPTRIVFHVVPVGSVTKAIATIIDSDSKFKHFGNALFQPATNSTTAFQIFDSAGTGVAGNFDTTNLRLGVRTSSPSEAVQISEFASASDQYILMESAGGNYKNGLKLKSFNTNYGFTIHNDDTAGVDALVILHHNNSAAGSAALSIDRVTGIFSIYSADASDQIQIYHDNTDAYHKWNDGTYFFQTDEGTNTNTEVTIIGKGTGQGQVRISSGSFSTGSYYYLAAADSGSMELTMLGSAAHTFDIDVSANTNIRMWAGSSEGETKKFSISGYRTGDASRSLEIEIGVDAADTASFDGLSNYWFDGTIKSTAGAQLGDGGTTNYLNVDGDGDVSFAGTARIDWTKITANGVTLGDGPPTSGDTVSDLQTANDGNTYTVNEIAANAGQNLIVDFTGVTAFNWVQILGRVEEQAGHVLTVQLEITPFDDSAWHTFHVMKDQAANQNFENYSFFVPDDSAYINSGTVKVRFIHEMAGNANDDWVFDVVALYQ